MEKLPFDPLMDLIDLLYYAHEEASSEVHSRREPVAKLHARPSVAALKADPGLLRAWFGADATAGKARWEALSPFDAELEVLRLKLNSDVTAICVANGWTDEELDAEIERRCDLCLRKSS